MPVHVEEVNAEITSSGADQLPSGEKLEALVQLVIRRMRDQSKQSQEVRQGTRLHNSVLAAMESDEGDSSWM